MKKIQLAVLFSVMLSLIPLSLGFSQDNLTGRQIAEKVQDANKSRSRIIWANLTVLENGKEMETRQIITKSFREKELDKVMFRFLSGLKRNVTFLSLEQEGNRDNIQYIFIPNVGRPRQIASSEKQNDFEDTDFTNEDLGGRKIDDYNYTRLPDKEVRIGSETFDCYVLLAEKKDSDARFPKVRSWIDKKTLIPVQIQSFGKDGKPKRVGASALIKEVKKGIFMPFYIYAKDLESKHETKMTVVDVLMDPASVTAVLFKPENMSKPWAEKAK